MTAVRVSRRTGAPVRRRAPRPLFHLAAVRTLAPGGPPVRLYGRRHIDLLRVAAALCRR
ncbi:hypothetical protein OG552_02605 [Streptomyces sp. NBC_01476]|uniref:putative leader peptide n=1 Tax=Streptomyces sp. NBC_01476 TaxID=2903881 RepID=UPI002E36427D|nr:putative leader peptide [Streptomyces sp. NBC_01476]